MDLGEFVKKEDIIEMNGKFYGVGCGGSRIKDYIAVIKYCGQKRTYHKISEKGLYKRCRNHKF